MTHSSESAHAPVHEAVATIDNGSFGTRTVRFETGRLARQAAGSAVAYLDDDTMVLSATTASKSPREGFDFFPLTVDVEERMYAAGRIPGSFFRREGRPSEDAILTCRLIDRPLRPSFVKGLRNEVQVVITVLALDPDACVRRAGHQRRLSVHPTRPACRSAARSVARGSHSSTASGSRSPTLPELERATFDMVVAGRVLESGEVAIMMVEAEATENAIELIAGEGHSADRGGRRRGAGGGQAVHRRAVPRPGRAGQGRRKGDGGVSRSSSTTRTTCSPP